MSVQVETLEKNMAKLTITVPADKFVEATKKAYNKNKNRFAIPGFRKGKVPMVMIEKMYGPSVFYEDAANDLTPPQHQSYLADRTARLPNGFLIAVGFFMRLEAAHHSPQLMRLDLHK